MTSIMIGEAVDMALAPFVDELEAAMNPEDREKHRDELERLRRSPYANDPVLRAEAQRDGWMPGDAVPNDAIPVDFALVAAERLLPGTIWPDPADLPIPRKAVPPVQRTGPVRVLPPNRAPVSGQVRFQVLKRDRFACQYCGRRAPEVRLECDHIFPRARGGSNNMLNLTAACEDCNGGKSATLLGDSGPSPALFDGRHYRRRSEAHWAAFFDRLGWHVDYAELRVGDWMPDFRLHSPTGGWLLAEVSHRTGFDQASADRMVKACWDERIHDDVLGLLLLAPTPASVKGMTRLGWLGTTWSDERKASWMAAPLTWEAEFSRPIMRPDILSIDDSLNEKTGDISGWHGLMTEACGPGFPRHLDYYVEHALAQWDDAGRAVSVSNEGRGS